MVGYDSDHFWQNSLIIQDDFKKYLTFLQTLITKLSVAFGIIISAILYYYKTDLPKKISNKYKLLYLFSLNKWYFDELYNKIFVIPSLYIADFFWKRGRSQNLVKQISRLKNINGTRIIKGHAFTKTILHDPTMPDCSIDLKGNQYKPQAQELTTIIRLRILSDLNINCI